MDVWYNLYMHVCFTGLQLGETVKLLKVPIIIGTVPLQQQMDQLELGAGEPLIPGTNLPQPSTEPCVFGPYSITEKNDGGSIPEVTFTPLYVTYSKKSENKQVSEYDE
ncbi:hypothetical protein L9F63_013104 [Diploptera punctata]|uniref:Uncharacterized protein n=1 Tax=Diploptera punctata TaxID=6984 RepID=A0AAD8EML0_DIPPU|nr:hypothetical protein L9F63_013104 [Diploptera punctata]